MSESESIPAVIMEQEVPCPHCDKTFSALRNMRIHARVHKDALTFLCPACEKSYPTRQKLQSHVQSAHGQKEAPDQNPAVTASDKAIKGNPASYKCGECDLSFRDKEFFELHKDAHIKGVIFTCPQCLSLFTDRKLAIIHRC